MILFGSIWSIWLYLTLSNSIWLYLLSDSSHTPISLYLTPSDSIWLYLTLSYSYLNHYECIHIGSCCFRRSSYFNAKHMLSHTITTIPYKYKGKSIMGVVHRKWDLTATYQYKVDILPKPWNDSIVNAVIWVVTCCLT